jgi:protein SCO1/2
MRIPTNTVAFSLFVFALLLTAQSRSVARTQAMENGVQTDSQESVAKKYFTDVVLLDQDGKERRLYTDLIKGHTVIVIPFFTSCTGACPAMNQNLAGIQDWLGDRLGKDAVIMSLSVDPDTDSVARLKEYSKKFGARPGWYFLSGKKENVEFALRKLGLYVETREDHSNIMIIGNEKTGLWKKAFSLAKTESLIKLIESVLNDKIPTAN